MSTNLDNELDKFYIAKKFNSKGKLSVALVVTQHAKKFGLPLQTQNLLTDGGGQVLGLGKGAVQNILSRHAIDKVLAQEGGRTSRGSINAMKDYAAFLNDLNAKGLINLEQVEDFWIKKVKIFFSAKPFRVKLDNSNSLRSLVRDLLYQAEVKQKDSQGVYYVGAILQHLVGAKLDCALGKGLFSHNSFSTSDAQTGRYGDFFIGDVAIHVTTTPTESLLLRCKENLESSLRPVIVTNKRGVNLAEALAENIGLNQRIDIFEIEQFIALNIYEFAKFAIKGTRIAVEDVVNRYNEIVAKHETDPSLLIEIL
jgi:hypothetical protein